MDNEIYDFLNNIQNNKLIKIKNNWNFVFLEEDLTIASPVQDYYFKSADRTLNISLTLK